MTNLNRRRSLLPLPEQGFTLDFNAMDMPTQDPRLILGTNSGIYYTWNFTTVGELACFVPAANSYIALANPCYGCEALELDCFVPYTNGPIVSCGNEIAGDHAPMLFRYASASAESYVQLFQGPGQFSDLLVSTQALKAAPVRKRMRVERRGSNVTYFINTDPTLLDLVPVASFDCVWNSGTSALNNALTGLEYRSGFAFVSGAVYLNYIKWERL